MTDGFEPEGLEAVPLRTAEAAAALEALREPAERTAEASGQAFDRAGETLTRSLARAAADGEVTLAEMTRAGLVSAVGIRGRDASVSAAAGCGV